MRAADDGPTPPSPTSFQSGERSPAGTGDVPDELLGATIGVYEIERFAGAGGMARVYRARHTSLERRCALKVLNPELVERHPDHVEQFFTEARAAACLAHPNVVTIHNIVEEQGLHAIEMEWVDGASLEQELLQRGRLEPMAAAAMMAAASAGLGAAHRQRIIHRDIKPSNVLLVGSGALRRSADPDWTQCKLADFGLARRQLAPGRSSAELAGTPQFMAPEIFRGGLATPRTDVFAAGVTLFLLLTGRFPFPGESFLELSRLHREGVEADVRELAPEVPEPLARVVDRCLERRENARFEDGVELARALREAVRQIRPLAELLGLAIAGLDVAWRALSETAIEAEVPLQEGRTQRVRIEVLDGLSGVSLISVFSPCAPVDDSYVRRALELNSRIDHGALAIEPFAGEPYFVMRGAYPRATCDPEELRETLLTVAREADAIEKLLLGSDRH